MATRLKSVLTGDLIGSRKSDAKAINASMRAIKGAAETLGRMYEFDPRFTRYRGDGWQILVPPKFSFLACLGISAALRTTNSGLATRIAIGIGTVGSLGTENLADADGDAFETSGAMLDYLSRSHGLERMMIDGPGITKWQQGIIEMTDWIVRGWTAQQAEAVSIALLDPDIHTNERRAAKLKISRQAFEARLKGSGLYAMTLARGAFQRHDWNMA